MCSHTEKNKVKTKIELLIEALDTNTKAFKAFVEAILQSKLAVPEDEQSEPRQQPRL